MNTQGIQQSDAWMQFVKLTAQARMRNEGLTKSGAVSANAKKQQLSPFPSQQYVKVSSFKGMEQVANKRILGGLFDAYA